MYVDNTNAVYVVDRVNHRVQKWNAGAATGTTVAGSTSDPGVWSYQFNNPTSITFDPQGFMYVLDLSNDRVQKWWPGAPYGQTVVSANVMASPIGMQFDLLGNMVITDTSNHRVLSFPIACRKCYEYRENLLQTIDLLFLQCLQRQQRQRQRVSDCDDFQFNLVLIVFSKIAQSIIPLCSSAAWNQTFSTKAGSMSTAGSTGTLINNPYDVGFDAYQNMYVVDYSNHRIQFFPAGTYQKWFLFSYIDLLTSLI